MKLTVEERQAKAEFRALCGRVIKELAPAAKASAKTKLAEQYEREWLEQLRYRREAEERRKKEESERKAALTARQRELKRERDRRYRERKRAARPKCPTCGRSVAA